MSRRDRPRHVTRWLMALTALAVTSTACGGGSDTATATDATSSNTKTLASLVIIDRDTSVRPVGTAAYRSGNEGETLGVGDSIQTSATGFAEIAYFDGSLTRVDRSGEFTLTALTDTGSARQVKGTLVGGRAWNRVTKAAGSTDQFQIDTPVASASVRGTAFAIDCTNPDTCVFTVVEGIVEVTPTGAPPVLVTAPAQLTVRRNTPPTAPTTLDTTTINNDPWITKNTTRDTATGKAPTTTTGATSTTTSTVATTTTSTTASVAPTTIAPRPSAPATTAAVPPPTQPPPTDPPTTVQARDLSGTWNVSYTNVRIVQANGCYASASLAVTSPGLFTITVPAPCFGSAYAPRSQYGVLVLSCTSTTCDETLPGNAAGWRPLHLDLAADGSVTHANFDPGGSLASCQLTVPRDPSVQVSAGGNALRYQQVQSFCLTVDNSMVLGWTVELTRR